MTDNGDIFRERIREVVQARIGDYLPNERNPKIHGELQNERLRAILENWGKVGVLLTFKDDDGRDVIFDGHARRNQNPDETWHIALTDLTRQEANELVLMYDPIAALATMDRAQMDGLLREVQTTDAGLAKMLDEMAIREGIIPPDDPREHWQGMPEFEQEDKTAHQSIHVHFKSEEDVQAFAELIGQNLTEKTRAIWFPEVERTNMRDYYDTP